MATAGRLSDGCLALAERGLHRRLTLSTHDAALVLERACRTEPALRSDHDKLLVAAVDELWQDRFVSDETWAGLATRLRAEQLMEICALTGLVGLQTMLHTTFPDAYPAPSMSVRGAGVGPAAAIGFDPTPARTVADSPWHRLSQPRIEPGGIAENGVLIWAAARIAGLLIGAPTFNLFAVLGFHRRMVIGLAPLAIPVQLLNQVPRFDLELATLRVGWNTRSEYEWFQHDAMSRLLAGVPADRIAATMLPLSDGDWSARDSTLLTAVDELHSHRRISPETLCTLQEFHSDRVIAHLIVYVGGYEMLAMMINSAGVQPEADGWTRGPLIPLIHLREGDRRRAIDTAEQFHDAVFDRILATLTSRLHLGPAARGVLTRLHGWETAIVYRPLRALEARTNHTSIPRKDDTMLASVDNLPPTPLIDAADRMIQRWDAMEDRLFRKIPGVGGILVTLNHWAYDEVVSPMFEALRRRSRRRRQRA